MYFYLIEIAQKGGYDGIHKRFPAHSKLVPET